VAEESEAACSVTAYAVQTVVRHVGDFADAVGAQVGKFRRFEVAQTCAIGLPSGAWPVINMIGVLA